MRKLNLWMQVTVDGYTAGPNGEFDWPQVGPELQRTFVDELSQMGGFVYGRNVFQMMAGFWPTADEGPSANPFTVAYSRIWKPMPKFAFSRTLGPQEWNTAVVSGDLVEAVKELKAQPGADLVCFGGATLAGALIAHDLIDDYRLNIHPVRLGAGQPLFPTTPERAGLRLVSARSYDAAVLHVHYTRG